MPSYSPIYSAQLIVYTTANPIVDFEVPDGFTAIVRDMDCYQNEGGYVVQLGFQNTGGAPLCAPVAVSAVGAENHAQWRGRLVVPAGGIISLYFSSLGSSVSCYVGGYLIRNVAS